MLTPWLCCLMLFMMTDGVISRAAVSDILVDADRTDVRCDPATDENLCDDGRSDTLDVCTPSTNACAHIEFEFKVDYLVANRIQPTSSAEFSEGSDAANNGARNVGDPCTFPRPCYPGETTQTDFYSKFFPDCQGSFFRTRWCF